MCAYDRAHDVESTMQPVPNFKHNLKKRGGRENEQNRKANLVETSITDQVPKGSYNVTSTRSHF